MISAVLICTGRLDQINESIAGFLSQDLEDRELIVVNTCFRQTLSGEFPKVRIYNLKQQCLPGRAKNWAIDQARGERIIMWGEQDYQLSGFLSQINAAMEGKDWCWLDKEIEFDDDRVTVVPGTEYSFCFTKSAWQKVGQYGAGINGASDRNFIGKITQQFSGEKTAMAQDGINVIQVGGKAALERVRPSIRCGVIKLAPQASRDYQSIIKNRISGVKQNEICVVELGRYGDIINLLPYLKLINDRYKKPSLMVSAEFADLLEGVSYVKPFVTQLKNEELGQALSIARQDFSIVVNAQVWGRGYQQVRQTESYNMESWRNVGMLHKFGDNTLRPVFDQRNYGRESALIELCRNGSDKPMILVNVSRAVSSPCPQCAFLLDEVKKVWGLDYNVVDISQIRAERLFDFIGVMEQAVALFSIDTSFLHLAAAVNIPVIAIVNPKGNNWASTKVRGGNCLQRIPYDTVVENVRLIHEGIAEAAQLGNKPLSLAEEKFQKPNRVFHCVERHDETNAKTYDRKLQAWKSWDTLYERGELIPAHYWNYKRTADKEVGDSRPLPFLKDLLEFAMNQAEDSDIIMFSNDDNILHPDVAEYVRFHVSVYGVLTSFRSEFRGRIPSLAINAFQFDQGSEKHMGRDLFAASKKWLLKHWSEIPDFILGCSDFDLCLAAMVRNEFSITTTNKNIQEPIFPADAMRGFVAHAYHSSHWSKPDYQDVAPGQKHNRKLFKEWAQKHCPTLQFNENNTLK